MEKKITHWDVLRSYDPELSEKVAAWRGEYEKREVLPIKYQELMKLSMACAIRYSAAIEAHGKAALARGATKEEVFATISLAMTIGGVPAYREAATVLKDVLMEDRD